MEAAYRGLSSRVIAPCTAVVCVLARGPGSPCLYSRAPAPFPLCRLADASEWSQHRPGAPFQSSIEPLMLEYQVDLLITGHQHCLERIHPVHNGTNLECTSCRVCVCACLPIVGIERDVHTHMTCVGNRHGCVLARARHQHLRRPQGRCTGVVSSTLHSQSSYNSAFVLTTPMAPTPLRLLLAQLEPCSLRPFAPQPRPGLLTATPTT